MAQRESAEKREWKRESRKEARAIANRKEAATSSEWKGATGNSC